MNKNKKLIPGKGFWIIVLIIITLFCLFMAISITIQRDYYKDQMLNFCELSLLHEDIIFELDPDISLTKFDEPCSYWELGK